MNYKINIKYNDNRERVLDEMPRPTAGTFWSLLDSLETRKIQSFEFTLSK